MEPARWCVVVATTHLRRGPWVWASLRRPWGGTGPPCCLSISLSLLSLLTPTLSRPPGYLSTHSRGRHIEAVQRWSWHRPRGRQEVLSTNEQPPVEPPRKLVVIIASRSDERSSLTEQQSDPRQKPHRARSQWHAPPRGGEGGAGSAINCRRRPRHSRRQSRRHRRTIAAGVCHAGTRFAKRPLRRNHHQRAHKSVVRRRTSRVSARARAPCASCGRCDQRWAADRAITRS